jgi:hypothetical protein
MGCASLHPSYGKADGICRAGSTRRTGRSQTSIIQPANRAIPAKAGIQTVNNSACKRDNITVLSASQSIFYNWIPVVAGMTA